MPVSHTLWPVHRSLVLLLIPALLSTWGVVPSLHTHVYEDHDHPEHHHGLAAHDHDAAPVADEHGTAVLEECDPGNHTVSYAFVCAAPPQVHAGDAEVTLPGTPIAEPPIAGRIRHTDVRVHGPPRRTQSPPRAPPLIAHA